MLERNYYVDWFNKIAIADDELYDSIYELASEEVNATVFLCEQYDMTEAKANCLLVDFDRDFYIYDSSAYQDWESEKIDNYIHDNFIVYTKTLPEDTQMYVIFSEEKIGTFEEMCDMLYDEWYDMPYYMKSEYPDVSEEDYAEYQAEYDTYLYDAISAYIADYAKII